MWAAPASRPSRSTRRRSCCCGTAPTASRSTCCVARAPWSFSRACTCSRVARHRPPTGTSMTGWARPRRRGASGSAATPTRRVVSSSPRCARRSRSRASCSPARTRTPWSPTRARRTCRPRGSRWRTGSTASPSSSPSRASCCAPTCSGRGRTGSPRSSSRGATTPGSSWPPCPRGRSSASCRARPTAPCGRPWRSVLESVDAGKAMMLPPTAITCREVSEFHGGHHPHGIGRA